jgi:excisionase family DNA binding protein
MNISIDIVYYIVWNIQVEFVTWEVNMNTKFEDLPRYLTPRQASELLQISLSSFYKSSWKGDIPTTKCGGRLRVDKYRLEKYLDSRTRSENMK